MTAKIWISGFVQGVGFRQFVKREARKLELTGYAKNLPDGRVEVLVQSSANSDQEAKENIEKLIKYSQKGPFLSKVENITVDWIDSTPKFDDFEVVH
ncbi:MAG TPA: acylphosphatase [Patescibacteria group bacterium]|nr:acylphosphatase [Patescibacteria group bacterium]